MQALILEHLGDYDELLLHVRAAALRRHAIEAFGAGRSPELSRLVMIYSGEPIREPVSMGGPFVMNTRAEIEQAFRDFHSGKFGDVPRQARLEHL